MKIKTWLLLTYLIVMLLPLAATYGLYMSINAYYQDKNVKESLETRMDISRLNQLLSKVELYNYGANYSELKSLENKDQYITLYTSNGFVLYSSNPLLVPYSSFHTQETVMKHLYELKQNYRAFVYKEPVFNQGNLIGFYEIELKRSEWTMQVENRTIIVALSLAFMLFIFYIILIYLLNRRFNRPVKQLMDAMRAFAKGQPVGLQMIERKDEIGELAQSFQHMKSEIEKSRYEINKAQQQKEFMIASLSHDLKTPLTSIQAYAEGLKSATSSEQQEFIEVIVSKSEHMKQMLEDLMMYTLLESANYEIDLCTVDGNEFFEMALSEYEMICIEKGFTVEISNHVYDDIAVNPKQFMRVIDNLVANAWAYTYAGGFIGIGSFTKEEIPSWCASIVREQLTDEGIYIVVQNSSQMISNEKLQRLFEPLYQMDDARHKNGQRGAGLGLSIAKRIIEKHFGTISVVSKNNETAFICWLPKGDN